MDIFELMYQGKDKPQKVSAFLEDFLLFEIYSPMVIRLAKSRWTELPSYVKKSVHPEIQELIQKVDNFSITELRNKINAHTITRAINTLLGYKNCEIPLTKSPTIPTIQKNLLSLRGEWALKRLLHAACHGEETDALAELALRTSHKFLMDLSYYKKVHLTLKDADNFILKTHKIEKGTEEFFYLFPCVQLTQGCTNGCSHCFCDAKNHLSYMPYPLWRGVVESLDKYYKYYEGIEWGKTRTQRKFFLKRKKQEIHKFPYSFSRFFHDSDPSQYHDFIMGVDGGDVTLWASSKGFQYYFLTKGITNDLSKRAIAKACKVEPIDLSFVDTPKENMSHNIRQLKQTIDLIHSVPLNKGVGHIIHTHLKTPSVSAEKIFEKETILHHEIVPSGRANQFPISELSLRRVHDFYPFSINPNGDLVHPVCDYGHYQQKKLTNLFGLKKERE